MSELATLPVQAYLLACVLAGAIGCWLGLQAWRERAEPGGIEVAMYLVGGGAVSILYAIRVASSNATVMVSSLQLATPITAALPVLFLLFTLAYAGHDTWRTEQAIVALSTPAFLWVIVAWSSRTHGLARGTFESIVDGPFTLVELGLGPVGFAFVVYAGLLYIGGILIIIDLYRRTGNRYRLGTFLAVLGTLFPIVAAFATIVDLGSFSNLEWTPVAFVLHGVFLYGTVFWLGTLDASVAARDTAVEVMQDPVLVTGSDGMIRDLNPAAQALFPADAVGTSLATAIPGLGRADDPHLSREDREFDVQIDPITDPRGTDRGYVVLLRDVTERERRQSQLERRERQLERQNERLEEFAGVVSHDLRNPLAAATAGVEMAKHAADGAPDALDRAAAAHDRMDDLIEGLLSLATAGKTVEAVDRVSMDAAVRTVWSRLETESATIEIDADVDIFADEDRLHQLLANLFRNAIEHGGSDVVVSVHSHVRESEDTRTADEKRLSDEQPTVGGAKSEDDDQSARNDQSVVGNQPTDPTKPTKAVRLRICDDGPGIPPAERDRVFERGVTLNEGTGLGLSIVRDIADAHGWTVGVVDGRTDGACFEIDGIEPVDTPEYDATPSDGDSP